MKHLPLLILLTNLHLSVTAQRIITDDISNFWTAYDQITATADSAQRHRYLQEFFLDKGSPGLEAIMKARRYTASSYLEAIRSYPQFWESIRPNTLKAKAFAKEIEEGLSNLKQQYPHLRKGDIYFTIGALRTNGTTMNGQILIGAELAMADEHTISDEFPAMLSHLSPYFKGNPIKHLAFLTIHEFVHLQQPTTIGQSLLAQSVYEGIAEFMAVLASSQPSPTPAIAYGQQHDQKIREAFRKEMFSRRYDNWLMNDYNNSFGMRDLGYYVGYAIAEAYYEQARDPQVAVKKMIELDCSEENQLFAFVDQSGYFDRPMRVLQSEDAQRRPRVQAISPFRNGEQDAAPDTGIVTLTFSTAMDTAHRGFDFGPLGESSVMRIQEFLGFSKDGRSVSFKVKLHPGRRYQMLVTDRFRDMQGERLIPFLIDIKTASRRP